MIATLSLRLSFSEVLGPHVLLSYYAAHVISCSPGVLSSLSPFLGCRSGSSELDWGSVELLRTCEVHFANYESTFHPGLCLGWALWVCHAMSFSGSLSREQGCGVLCFRHGLCGEDSGPLPCSSVCGLHCTGPTNARQS